MGAHEIPAESLLAHAAFLRRLAGSLVADPGTADDLVQETWLAAVRRPPEDDRPVGGWLATVLRNVGRKLRRSGGRRDRRERASARRESVPSAEEQVARGEVVREVVEAIFRLDAPQRAVVLMRFYEDLPPREIARRLAVPANTVKSRLRLALAHLRQDLDGRSPSLRGDWRAAMAPALGLGSAAVGGGAAVAAGGVVVGTKTTVAASVALVAALGTVAYVGLADDAPDRAPDPTPPLAGASDGTNDGRRPALAGADRPAPAAPAPVAPVPPVAANPLPDAPNAAGRPPVTRELLARLGFTGKTPPDTLEAVVLDGTTPVDGGTGILWKFDGNTGPEGIPADHEPAQTGTVGRDGRFRFAGLADDQWFLGVKLADDVRRLVFRGLVTGKEENDRVLLVLGDATVAGTVFDEGGRPAAGVRVRVSVETADLGTAVAETRTDAQGLYEIARLPSGSSWVSVAFGGSFDDSQRTRRQAISVAPGTRTTVDFGSRLGIARLRGTLRFGDGEAVRGRRRVILASRRSSEYVDVAVAADGTYDQRVPEGTYRVDVWNTTAHLYDRLGVTTLTEEVVVGFEDMVRDIVLPGARIVGTVGAGDAQGHWVTLRRVDTDKPGQVSEVVRADGSYAWVGVRPGTYELTVGVGSGAGALRSIPTRVVVGEGDGEIRRDLAAPR